MHIYNNNKCKCKRDSDENMTVGIYIYIYTFLYCFTKVKVRPLHSLLLCTITLMNQLVYTVEEQVSLFSMYM